MKTKQLNELFNKSLELLEVNKDHRPTRNYAIKIFSQLLLEGATPRVSETAASIMSILFPHSLREDAASNHEGLVEQILTLVKRARQFSYPEGLTVSPWWLDKQKTSIRFCSFLTNAVDVVMFAQCTHLGGVDRRLYEDQDILSKTIINQLKAIEDVYDICIPLDFSVEETPYSMESSIFDLAGKKYSNSFLDMVGYYLGSAYIVAQKCRLHRVMEIGAGYGSLARIIKLQHSDVRYVILDVPETLLLSAVFLNLSFPKATIRLVTTTEEYKTASVEDPDFLLVPAQLCNELEGSQFDLLINTGSLQEMPESTVDTYFDLLENKLDIRYFYSFNYFLNSRRSLTEWAQADTKQEASNICPKLDPWWRVLTFKLNPSNLTVDCRGRNWLELLVERKPQSTRDDSERIKHAAELYSKTHSLPILSDAWLASLWAAIWSDPDPRYIERMIAGLDLFIKGWHNSNNMYSGVYGSPLSPSSTMEERVDLGQYMEELVFYHRYLRAITQS